jgi:hypothetical protein
MTNPPIDPIGSFQASGRVGGRKRLEKVGTILAGRLGIEGGHLCQVIGFEGADGRTGFLGTGAFRCLQDPVPRLNVEAESLIHSSTGGRGDEHQGGTGSVC